MYDIAVKEKYYTNINEKKQRVYRTESDSK